MATSGERLVPGELILRFEYDVPVDEMIRRVTTTIGEFKNVTIVYTNTDEEAEIYRPTCRVHVPIGREADWIKRFRSIPGIVLVYQSVFHKYDLI